MTAEQPQDWLSDVLLFIMPPFIVQRSTPDGVAIDVDANAKKREEARATILTHMNEAVGEAMFRERSHVIHDAQNRLYTLDGKKAEKYFGGFDPHDGMQRLSNKG